jgi:hypothetical protein
MFFVWPGCSGSCPRPARRVRRASPTRLRSSFLGRRMLRDSTAALTRQPQLLKVTQTDS